MAALNMFERATVMTDAGTVSRMTISKTYPGMAHFGGTAPEIAPCASCVFFQKGNTIDGKGVCNKFKALTNRRGPAFPGHASACRHFDRRPGK